MASNERHGSGISFSRRIEIVNDYHQTSAVIEVLDREDGVQLTIGQLRRAEAKLCGQPDCPCGGFAHGPQGVTVLDEGYDRNGNQVVFLLF